MQSSHTGRGHSSMHTSKRPVHTSERPVSLNHCCLFIVSLIWRWPGTAQTASCACKTEALAVPRGSVSRHEVAR